MDPYSFGPLRDADSMPFWSFSPEVANSRSAFASYTGAPTATAATTGGGGSSDRNVHKRVMELLRRIPRDEQRARGEPQGQGSRGFRHMMRERQRREKMSQCYADLHTILSFVHKGDKNSIVQTAAVYIEELERRKEELRMRNEELMKKKKRRAGASEEENGGGEVTKIKIREANPMCTVDSMIGALRCLKAMDVKARAIDSEFSGCELTAVVSIETKVGGENIVGVY